MNIAVETKTAVKAPDVLSYREVLLPKKKPGIQAYFIWMTSLCFALFQFFIQLSAGQVVTGLMKSFNLTAFGAGLLSSASYYIYVILQTPAGVLMDRHGPRKVLTIGSAILMIGCFVFASAHNLSEAFMGRLMMGLGAAFAFVGNLYLIDKWFPEKYFTMMTGIVEMSAMLGTLIGAFWLAHYVERSGWRSCMYVSAAISGALSLCLGLIIRDMPAHRLALKPLKDVKRRVLPGLLVLVRMRVAWINGIYSGVMFSVVSAFAALWAIPYLEEAHNLSLMQATFYCSLVYIGTGIFTPLLGWFDTKIKHRRWVMFGCALLGFACVMVVIVLPQIPLPYLGLCMFLIGVAASAYVLTFAVANQIAALRIRSASIGFVNTLSVGGTPLLQPLIGLVLFLLARHNHVFDMKRYTLHEFQLALMIIPTCLALAAWLSLFIPSRRP